LGQLSQVRGLVLQGQYGDAATKENDYGYDYHPKIRAIILNLPMFVDMMDGRSRLHVHRAEPAVEARTRVPEKSPWKTDWLVVRDFFESETSAFWRNSPEIKAGN